MLVLLLTSRPLCDWPAGDHVIIAEIRGAASAKQRFKTTAAPVCVENISEHSRR